MGGCKHPPFHFSPAALRVFRPRPADTSRASGEGKDGSDPPFLTAGAVSRGGGVNTGVNTRVNIFPPLCGGRSRLYVSLQEDSPARVRAGRSDPPRRAMFDALLRAFLVIGGISAVAAWTWPGVFPQADPVAVLVRYHTPNVYTGVVAWYYVAPGVGRVPHRPIPHQHVADLVRPDGRQSRAPVAPAPRGRFRRRRTARRSSSAKSITRSDPSRARAPNG